LPYCRRCGTQLEENARFCRKCGTQVVIFSPSSSIPAKSASKSLFSTSVIVLIAVVAAAVIVSVLVFSTFYPVNFNRANTVNQTNVHKLSFNPQEGMSQANVLAQNLTDKTVFIAVSATTIQRTNRPSSRLKEG
jgi:hypothetical protein